MSAEEAHLQDQRRIIGTQRFRPHSTDCGRTSLNPWLAAQRVGRPTAAASLWLGQRKFSFPPNNHGRRCRRQHICRRCRLPLRMDRGTTRTALSTRRCEAAFPLLPTKTRHLRRQHKEEEKNLFYPTTFHRPIALASHPILSGRSPSRLRELD